jgi:hypothetical protein
MFTLNQNKKIGFLDDGTGINNGSAADAIHSNQSLPEGWPKTSDRSSVKEYEVVFANEAVTQNRLVMCIWSS